MYHDGKGTVKDLRKAEQWFRSAASKGDARAQYRLAMMHVRKQTAEPNITMAVELLRRSAAQGYPGAREALDRVQKMKASGEI